MLRISPNATPCDRSGWPCDRFTLRRNAFAVRLHFELLQVVGQKREPFIIGEDRTGLAPTNAQVGEVSKCCQQWPVRPALSLAEMGIEHVDAYYHMAENNVSVVKNEEIYRAFEDAKAAGKVDYLGLSTHQNADAVLRTAIETGWYDLAMIAITPGGWYDWQDKSVLDGSPTMKALRPLLDEARAAGIGLVGMKAGRFLAGRPLFGWGNPDAFDEHYDERLMQAKLSEFQRSYAYVLEHGLDVVNADMQSMLHLKENFVAAATSADYFDIA